MNDLVSKVTLKKIIMIFYARYKYGNLLHDMLQRRVVVNWALNLRVTYTAEILLTIKATV